MKTKIFALNKILAGASCVLILAACGGGGSSANQNPSSVNAGAPRVSTGTDTPAFSAAPIASETPPAGATINLSGINLMPAAYGDSWLYDQADAGGGVIGSGNRLVTSLATTAEGEQGALLEIDNQNPGDSSVFVRKADGLYIDYTSDASIPPAAAQQIGLIREYAFPAYAVDETRTVIRQGTWDQDVDGDGRSESFRIEYAQVFRGFENLALPWGTASVAHFSNTYRFYLIVSGTGEKRGVVNSEEAYFAPDLGPVKYVRHAEDAAGNSIQALRTWNIKSLQVGGRVLP
ncbi:hypothetical protein SAMN06265795_102255 [Noviherbaspirillum humi]|uniref:Lipoprotein n=2 Tax=Noviherbaspirillum humi TaxID=1688639 RepID=A0A239DN68_9BURK|nr:hypothetical protein SAMN06265795_102255 [Noviherbaspirillum humi]